MQVKFNLNTHLKCYTTDNTAKSASREEIINQAVKLSFSFHLHYNFKVSLIFYLHITKKPF